MEFLEYVMEFNTLIIWHKLLWRGQMWYRINAPFSWCIDILRLKGLYVLRVLYASIMMELNILLIGWFLFNLNLYWGIWNVKRNDLNHGVTSHRNCRNNLYRIHNVYANKLVKIRIFFLVLRYETSKSVYIL